MSETLFDALRESHERQRSLLRRLLRSKPGTDQRLELFTEVRIELAAHAAAEERYLYVPVLMDDQGLETSRHALHEHHQIDELIEDIEALDPAGKAWLDTAKELSHKVHHHLREEERKFFQISGKILNDRQKISLGNKYRRDCERLRRKLAAK